MKRDGEAVRFVADTLNEQQRPIARRERDRIHAIACVQQLLFFRDADGDQIGEPELLESRVSGGQLPLAAVDEHQVRKGAALLEQLAVATQDDFVDGRKIILTGFILTGLGIRDVGVGRRIPNP